MNRSWYTHFLIQFIWTVPLFSFVGWSIASALEPQQVSTDVLTDLEPILPSTPVNYSDLDLPDHFNTGQIRNFDNEPNNNEVTDAGATLGRVLFYDVNLSANNTVSCASCHEQENGFSDPNRLSVGFEGDHTPRNSMGLANARWYENGAFFWDERAESLEAQVLQPIQDPVEMGLSLDEMLVKLNQLDYYPDLFEDAFGSSEITSERVSLALAQFVRSMVSYQSKYDVGVQTDFANFTAQELEGMDLFDNQGCDRCHRTDLFILDEASNNGLDETTTDRGLGAVTGNTADDGKFKVNSLRNIGLTAPYMHDGRFETLEEVIEFYSTGVQDHPNLANEMTRNNGTPRRLNLDDDEVDALVAFLHTLTDTSFSTDEKFSDPFVNTASLTETIYLPMLVR